MIDPQNEADILQAIITQGAQFNELFQIRIGYSIFILLSVMNKVLLFDEQSIGNFNHWIGNLMT